MNTSDAGLRFIASFEGLRNDMYDDGGPGIGNCTIGVGHLIHYGPIDGRPEEQPFVNGLTDDECYALMRLDVIRFETVVNAYASIALNQNQYDALVDFCYNTGGNYPLVWHSVNNGGDVAAILMHTAITPAWATAGLLRRRKAEGDLYNTAVSAPAQEDEDMAKVVFNTDDKRVYLVGFKAPIWLTDQNEVDQLVKAYGPQIAVSAATMNQMVP